MAASDKPIDFNAGNIAPRFGKSAPLTSIHIKCKSARFVPMGRFSSNVLKMAMV
jgi:hypothetical protein